MIHKICPQLIFKRRDLKRSHCIQEVVTLWPGRDAPHGTVIIVLQECKVCQINSSRTCSLYRVMARYTSLCRNVEIKNQTLSACRLKSLRKQRHQESLVQPDVALVVMLCVMNLDTGTRSRSTALAEVQFLTDFISLEPILPPPPQ